MSSWDNNGGTSWTGTTWKRPLKKARLGPPDVYPQDAKQREDELSAVTLKQGFIYAPVSLDEYGSVRSSASHVPAGQVSAYFASLLTKRQELSVLQDSSKKRTLFSNKDNFFPAAQAKSNASVKGSFDAFFKELQLWPPPNPLPKRIPFFNKKEEVLLACYDYNVPYVKAAWFMKLLAAHAAMQTDVKVKKRQVNDPTLEWTMVLLRCLKDVLQKLSDGYRLTATEKKEGSSNGAAAAALALPTGATSGASADYDSSSKQWKYCFGLLQHLYEEALIDRHEVCSWLVETMEMARLKGDGGLLKLVAPSVLKFSADIFHSEILTRKLVSSCSRYLHSICGRKSPKSPLQLLEEALECSHHAVPVAICISMVQLALLHCTSACLWLLNLNDESSASRHSAGNGNSMACSNEGSPLDVPLPLPSEMPITPSLATHDPHFLQKLKDKEEELCQRSAAVEGRWANPQITADENKMDNVWLLVRTLEALDRYAFHKADGKDNLDKLYKAIKELLSTVDACCPTSLLLWRQEVEALVRLLCQWSVSTRRSGLHRALVIGLLLERLQGDVAPHWKTRHNPQEGQPPFLFQDCLMRYLDQEGAQHIKGHEASPDSPPFLNILLLFTELVNHHLFSHDLYVRALIASGLISQPAVAPRPPPPLPAAPPQYNPPQHAMMPQHSLMEHGGHDNNPGSYYGMTSTVSPKVASGASLYSFEQGGLSMSAYGAMSSSLPSPMAAPLYPPPSRQWSQPHANMVPPPPPPLYSSQGMSSSYASQADYLTSDLSLLDGYDEKPGSVSSMTSEGPASTSQPSSQGKFNPHRTFLLHLPIGRKQDGQDAEMKEHEMKQRSILLYGVGRARQEAKDQVRRLTKDMKKLLSKKRCYDVSDASRLKSPKALGETCAQLRQRFKQLPVFDRQQINNEVMPALDNALKALLNGSSNYMPALETVTCILQQSEAALDVGQLLQRVIDILNHVKSIEALLVSRQLGGLAAAILPSVTLHCVGLLRKYHNCLVLSSERTAVAFDALRLIVANSGFMVGQCSSTERCVLACMYDLYQCCSMLQSRYTDFHTASRSISSIIMKKTKPATKAETWDGAFMSEYLQDLSRRPSADTIKRLGEPLGQHSFVVNTLIAVCRSQGSLDEADRVNEMAHLCAEMTASCIGLTAEWLAAFQALCLQFTFNKTIPYSDLLEVVKGYLGDKCVQERLAIFCCILVARHCIRLEDFIGYVAIVTLMAASRHATGDENGGRLVAHIMLRLLRGCHGPPEEGQGTMPVFYLKYPWDRALLASARRDLGVAPLLAVLKAMLVLSESSGGQALKNGQGSSATVKREAMDGDELPLFPSLEQPIGYEIAGLADFARMALREICQEEVARELVLKELENLFSLDLLLDPIMVVQQTRHLVHLICYPPAAAATFAEERPDNPMYIMQRILHSLDQWNIRICWVELQLMLEPPITSQSATGPNPSPQETAARTAEHNTMVETFGRAVIEAFQLKSPGDSCQAAPHHLGHVKKGKAQSMVRYEVDSGQHTWYIAALVAKLHLPVQHKVLKHIMAVIDKHPLSFRPKERDKMAQSSLLLACPPFISLMSTCMGEVPEVGKAAEGAKQTQGNPESLAMKENVLRAIHGQLLRFVEEEVRAAVAPTADERCRATVCQAISLRLSVVGSLFDCIQKRSHLALEWAVLLGQLIIAGCVDPAHSTPPVFDVVFDMLTVLTHNLLALDSLVLSQTSPGSAGQGEAKASTSASATLGNEERKLYPSLVKRLRKEIGDKKTAGILHIRSLLPMAKKNLDVLTVEAYGTTTDAKGNKIVPFEAVNDKRVHLLQALHKVQLNPWEIMEGFRNIQPLCWSFFGAVRLERRVPSLEVNRYLMAWHTHGAAKALSYYMEAPPIPLAIQQEEAASVVGDSEPAVSETTSLDTASPRSPRSARPAKSKRASLSQAAAGPPKKRQTKSPAALGASHFPASNMQLGAAGHLMPTGSNSVYGGGAETLPQPISWYNGAGGPAPHVMAASQQVQLAGHAHMGGQPPMHLPQQPPAARMMAASYNAAAAMPGPLGPAPSSYSLQQQQQHIQQQQQQQQQNRRMAAHLGARSNLQNLIIARQNQSNMQGQSVQQQQNPTLNYMLSAQGPSINTAQQQQQQQQQQMQAEAQRNLAMQQQQQQQQQGGQMPPMNPQMPHGQVQPAAGAVAAYGQMPARTPQAVLQQLQQRYPSMTPQQQQDFIMHLRQSQQQRRQQAQQQQQQQQQGQQPQQRYYGQNPPSQQQAVQYLSGPTPAPPPPAQFQPPDQRQQMFMHQQQQQQQQQPQQMYGQQNQPQQQQR